MTTSALYSNIEILDTEKHKGLRFKPFDDLRFCAGLDSALLAGSEFFDAAIEFPIVFTQAGEGHVAIAVLGLRSGENLFIGDDQRWDGGYIPAFCRRYPFLPIAGAEGPSIVGFDKSCANIGEEEGEVLIDTAGQATEYLKSLIAFLEQAQTDYTRSAEFARKLNERGLLQDMSATVETAGGEKLNLTGFKVVDEAKLRKIGSDDLSEMARSGELALVHAHLISLRTLPRLVERLQKRTRLDNAETKH